MSSKTKEQHVQDVTAATHVLNAALADAAGAGLKVEVDVCEGAQSIGQRRPCVRLEVTILDVLKEIGR